MKALKKLSLAAWIGIAMVLGIIVGLLLMNNPSFTTDILKPIGTIFLNLLKFIVVPIVLLSIIDGIISMKDIKKVGSVGWKTIVYYLCTTAVAILIGLLFANLFKGSFVRLDTAGAEYEAASTSIMDTIVSILPSDYRYCPVCWLWHFDGGGEGRKICGFHKERQRSFYEGDDVHH